MRLEFRILGPLEVCGEDEGALPLGGPKQRALLALLLLNRNQLVPNDRLLEEIWGGANPESAGRSLQVYVSQLRKILGGSDLLQTGSGGYSLAVDDEQLDATRFERGVREGTRLLESGQPEEAAEHFQQALALWRGAPLADLAYEEFVQSEIARLEELRLTAREELFEAELALGRHAELVGELETLVAEEPLRERPRRQLMLALYRTGRQAEALAVYQDARRSLVEELGLEPSPELKELEAAILRQDPALAVEPPELRARRHLPAPATALVGREKELTELAALLSGETPRLVTLTGAGGTGKTRLAIQAASALVDRFADGVYFVDLAPLNDPQLVPATIASRLGVQQHGGQPFLASVKEHLRDKRLLLLLDNFEHVDDAAPVVSELLAEASGLKVLVTSRALLRLYGEHEYPVPPLAEEEALVLFTTRAQAVRADFELDGARPQVLELCRRLDCLPLAIELAAARSGRFSPAEMLAVLPDRLALATQGARDLPARQQTLRATIDWSYGLLDESEQELFARLAVFEGGCSLEAAQSVCDSDLDELASLVEKSLLVETEGPDGEARFGMLETVREYARDRLDSSSHAEAMRARHAAYFVGVAEEAAAALWDPVQGPRRAKWLDRLESDHDNLRAALAWNDAHDAEATLRLAGALFEFWDNRGYIDEGRGWLERSLARAGTVPAAIRAKALHAAAHLTYVKGDYERGDALAEASLALYREVGDKEGAGRTLHVLGWAAEYQGQLERAETLAHESLSLARELGHTRGIIVSLDRLATAVSRRDDPEGAAALLEEGLALAREHQDHIGAAGILGTWGALAAERGELDAAERMFVESLNLYYDDGHARGVAAALNDVASLAERLGRPDRAALLFAAAEKQREAIGDALPPSEHEAYEAAVVRARATLGEETFAAHWATGRALALDQAVELARTAELSRDSG